MFNMSKRLFSDCKVQCRPDSFFYSFNRSVVSASSGSYYGLKLNFNKLFYLFILCVVTEFIFGGYIFRTFLHVLPLYTFSDVNQYDIFSFFLFIY